MSDCCRDDILPDDPGGNHAWCLPVADCDASVVVVPARAAGVGQNRGNQTERSESDRVEGIVTMMDGPMDGQMEEQMVLLQNMSTDWGNWMQSVGAQEVVVEVEGWGRAPP